MSQNIAPGYGWFLDRHEALNACVEACDETHTGLDTQDPEERQEICADLCQDGEWP